VLEVPGAVVVCFDAPTVELFEARAAAIHPVLTALGPDLLGEPFGEVQVAEAARRLRAPERASLSVAEALLDQTALAGIGNVYKSEVLFLERVYPFSRAADLPGAPSSDEAVRRLILTAHRLLLANREGGARDTVQRPTLGRGRPGMGSPYSGSMVNLWVYGRAGRPCRRCGSVIRDRMHGRLNRRTFWCPRCQPAPQEEPR
jgi:endonuclease-8